MTQPMALVMRLSSVFGPGVFKCQHIEDHGEASIRLKRFGICSGREIEVIQAGDPMVLRVLGTRVGISRELGTLIVVQESARELIAVNSEDEVIGGR